MDKIVEPPSVWSWLVGARHYFVSRGFEPRDLGLEMTLTAAEELAQTLGMPAPKVGEKGQVYNVPFEVVETEKFQARMTINQVLA